MYRKFAVITIVVLCSTLALSKPSFSFLNNYFTASILEEKAVEGRAGISISDKYNLYFAGADYGISKGIDISGRIGILDSDAKIKGTGVDLGIAGKYKAVFSDNPTMPEFALYATYDLGIVKSKISNALSGGLMVSKLVTKEESNLGVIPYLGGEVEVIGGSLNGSTNINLRLPIGVKVDLGKQYFLAGEVKIGPNTAGGIALSHKF